MVTAKFPADDNSGRSLAGLSGSLARPPIAGIHRQEIRAIAADILSFDNREITGVYGKKTVVTDVVANSVLIHIAPVHLTDDLRGDRR